MCEHALGKQEKSISPYVEFIEITVVIGLTVNGI